MINIRNVSFFLLLLATSCSEVGNKQGHFKYNPDTSYRSLIQDSLISSNFKSYEKLMEGHREGLLTIPTDSAFAIGIVNPSLSLKREDILVRSRPLDFFGKNWVCDFEYRLLKSEVIYEALVTFDSNGKLVDEITWLSSCGTCNQWEFNVYRTYFSEWDSLWERTAFCIELMHFDTINQDLEKVKHPLLAKVVKKDFFCIDSLGNFKKGINPRSSE